MAEIAVKIIDDSIDPAQLADLVDELREELLSLPVEETRLAMSPAPEGTRGQTRDLAIVIVKFALETGLVKTITDYLRDWSKRHRVKEIEIVLGDSRLILPKATEAQQQKLIEHFIDATSKK